MIGAKGQIKWIVTLRALAAAAIVMVHVIAGWLTGGVCLPNSRWVLDIAIIQPLIRWAVPCFFMISGALLLDPKREFGIRKTLTYMGRISVVLATVGFFYCLIETYISGAEETPLKAALISFRNLLEGNSWSHMWYLYALIGLYAFTPVFRCFVNHADGLTFRFILTVLFLITVVRATINSLFALSLTGFVSWESSSLLYYLAGRYLSERRYKKKALLWVMAASAVGLIALLFYGKRVGIDYTGIVGPENVFVCWFSMALFCLSKDLPWMDAAADKRLVYLVSKYSFGIYLFHPVIVNGLYKGLHVFPDVLPIGVGEAVFFAACLCGGWCASVVLCRIGIIRRYLM